MGSHGRRGVIALILGSVTAKVLSLTTGAALTFAPSSRRGVRRVKNHLRAMPASVEMGV